MASTFIITSEAKELRTLEAFRAGAMILTRSVYQPGYWFVTEYRETTPMNLTTSKHFVVSGGYSETSGVMPDRTEGWVSSMDTREVPSGVYRRESPDGCVMWCIWSEEREAGNVDNVSILKLAPGDSVTVSAGENLLVAEGACLANGNPIQNRRHFAITGVDKLIEAQELSYLIRW